MKTIMISLFIAATLTGGSIYDFNVDGLDGSKIDFSKYKGQKILIVNTASKCGLTPQYEGLESLYKQYKGKLVIIGFPANNFNGQEPGTATQIQEFCKQNYGVTFPMADKVSVKGDDTHELYKYLKEQAAAKGFIDPVTWNFGKFLINEKGELIATFSPRTLPMSEEIMKYLN
ncbi:MAG: glutathione peroxidase [Chitinophagaceae bacterium]|nr:glutathione peroxidase [Chitinophagaceae bacterium]MBK8606608.1 glutathione peroxidase [Chitinophagaceae bacterium]MBP6476093.1 glutathione peroxidase [Chitinophagaceae bacterium]MBP7107274.1 glutathione peroxidase [Chitinophagaceae bacterium]MBP7316194.1 glutathione peroxidase [Chitinophagaceae bacterium]